MRYNIIYNKPVDRFCKKIKPFVAQIRLKMSLFQQFKNGFIKIDSILNNIEMLF